MTKLLPFTLLFAASAASAAPADDDLAAAADATGAAPQILATPTFRSVMTTQNGLDVMKPTGTVAGDFLLAFAEYDAATMQLVPPAGWTLVHDQFVGGGSAQAFHAVVFSHRAGTSEPDEYMFSAPAGVFVDLQIAAYTGVTAVEAHAGVGAQASAILAPDLVTTVANELLVAFYVDFNFGSWSTAAGLTQRTDFDANSLQDVRIAAAGHTGKKIASCTFGNLAGIAITLK
jgi:hypothetical protein